jgi:hypothetical protein
MSRHDDLKPAASTSEARGVRLAERAARDARKASVVGRDADAATSEARGVRLAERVARDAQASESAPSTWRGALKTIEADAAAAEKIVSGVAERINESVTGMVGPNIAQILPSGKVGTAIARAEGTVIGGAVGVVDAVSKFVHEKVRGSPPRSSHSPGMD